MLTAVHGLQPKVLRKYIELSKVPGKVLRKYMELIKTEQALGDAIRTYTIYDTPTELDSSAILVHFRSATDTVICMDQWLKNPGFAEPFFKRVAMIMDPAAANTAWRTVPLCHTPKFDQRLPKHLQLAFQWTSRRYRTHFLVYPLGYRRGYAWSIRSTPFGIAIQQRLPHLSGPLRQSDVHDQINRSRSSWLVLG